MRAHLLRLAQLGVTVWLAPLGAAACADGGPWACAEEGCPAPEVDCATLSTACGAHFSDIWTVLPTPALRDRTVRDECKASCGECNKCELLSRDILSAADPATETFEVQQLRFALPVGSRASGHSNHIKVRAPDAPGQRNRIRAYSIHLDESANRFNLTVKVYPGGPPATRGTSAYLGSVAIGDFAHVPELREMHWAVAPMEALRVGLVAFGVGIAECLEPAELLLAAGAQVRFVTSNRREGQILYRERLREWLAAQPERFSVSHCLSREGAGGGAAHESSCAAGERIRSGRVSVEVIRHVFGDWASDTSGPAPYFLVVGTGAMEHSCWASLRAVLGARAKPLLTGTSGWRPLVSSPRHHRR